MVPEASESGTRKWLAIAGASAAILGLGLAILGYALAPRLREMARWKLQAYLETHFQSSVEFSSLRVDLFPRVHGVVDGLVMRYKGRTDIPPLIEIREASFDADMLTLLGARHEVSKVPFGRAPDSYPAANSGGTAVDSPNQRGPCERISVCAR